LVFVTAQLGENRLSNSNNLRNLKIAATKSKHDYDAPSLGRGNRFISEMNGFFIQLLLVQIKEIKKVCQPTLRKFGVLSLKIRGMNHTVHICEFQLDHESLPTKRCFISPPKGTVEKPRSVVDELARLVFSQSK
jgi:hypothetical protein